MIAKLRVNRQEKFLISYVLIFDTKENLVIDVLNNSGKNVLNKCFKLHTR